MREVTIKDVMRDYGFTGATRGQRLLEEVVKYTQDGCFCDVVSTARAAWSTSVRWKGAGRGDALSGQLGLRGLDGKIPRLGAELSFSGLLPPLAEGRLAGASGAMRAGGVSVTFLFEGVDA